MGTTWSQTSQKPRWAWVGRDRGCCVIDVHPGVCLPTGGANLGAVSLNVLQDLVISECSGWRPLRQRRASRSLAARVHGKGHLGAPHGRRLGKFGGLRGSGMKTVVSTTSISQSRCPGPRKEPLGTLRVERLRRIVDHSVSGMEIAASATRISMSGCSVSILRRVFLGTLSLERLSRRSL